MRLYFGTRLAKGIYAGVSPRDREWSRTTKYAVGCAAWVVVMVLFVAIALVLLIGCEAVPPATTTPLCEQSPWSYSRQVYHRVTGNDCLCASCRR